MGGGRQERHRDRRQVAPRPARRRGRSPGRDHRRRKGWQLPGEAERLLQVRGLTGQEPRSRVVNSLSPSGEVGRGAAAWGAASSFYGAVAAWTMQPAAFIYSIACSPVSSLTAALRLTSTRTWKSCFPASSAVARTQ